MSSPTPLALATLAGVMLCWFVFAGIFQLRKRSPKALETKRDGIGHAGNHSPNVRILPGVLPTSESAVPAPGRGALRAGIAVSVVTVAIAAGSGRLIATAVRTLGKQWALRARLVEDHKLITVGLYAYVRNPIYTGMLGMLVATGLATEHGIALPIAVVIFAVGMVIRARSEEKLLWAVFGEEFEGYARRVPAVLPGIF
jgi:protein-S-isoprenylcysteine O-methyltransferase Ste14